MKKAGISDVEVLGRQRYGIDVNRGEKGVIICRVGICNLFEFMLKLIL